jgi:hypothetical protein
MSKIKLLFEFIKNSLEVLMSILFSITRYSWRARTAFKIIDEIKTSNLVIAMNGPTLKDDLNLLDKDLKSKGQYDFAVANHFADTNYFFEHKPSYYFFSDPYFWDNNSNKNLIEKRNITFDNINNKTSWPIKVFIPAHIDSKLIKEKFSNNQNIIICPFNSSSLPSGFNTILGTLWNNNFCAPFGRNVLVHVIYGGIQLGYSKIAIVGAGFSFHEQISVDQKNNKFYQKRKHVYGETFEQSFVDVKKEIPAKVSHEFLALYISFKSLESVAQYALYKDCNITNYSNYSYLDMFDRPQ